uniref:ATP-binding cassette sub-family A member 5-like n=1 Tax=Saccoglossus kowalevskii TaxID=10224 RepID=A0ABM0M9Y7_SACKO|nr:PREDICTED: ATP-binding cassette sub-family A member 5-like [Saccoglossus kowalevskii]
MPRCLGSTQHLKDKYGGGYILEVKLKSSDDEEDVSTLAEKIQKLETFVMDAFPSANMIENFGERIMYKIPRDGVKSLAIVFDTLEEGKPELDIEEYSFSQSTLEQVFLQFAKMQVEEDRPDDEQITITPQ